MTVDIKIQCNTIGELYGHLAELQRLLLNDSKQRGLNVLHAQLTDNTIKNDTTVMRVTENYFAR